MEQKGELIKFNRPPNNEEFKQSKVEKDILSVSVLMSYPNSTAYALFHPELCDRDGKLNKAGQRECKMFFTHPNNIAYMNALRAHLSVITKGGSVVKVAEDSDSRKDNALKVLVNRALSLMEHGEDLDPETIKLIADIAVKLRLVKEEAETQIKPVRVLMAKCMECRYRICAEGMVLNGKMLDCCAFCKARKTAEEHGYRFNDGKDLLDIPEEVIADLEAKNNVKLEDIISGRIDN